MNISINDTENWIAKSIKRDLQDIKEKRGIDLIQDAKKLRYSRWYYNSGEMILDLIVECKDNSIKEYHVKFCNNMFEGDKINISQYSIGIDKLKKTRYNSGTGIKNFIVIE
jgi:hypothetical protein